MRGEENRREESGRKKVFKKTKNMWHVEKTIVTRCMQPLTGKAKTTKKEPGKSRCKPTRQKNEESRELRTSSLRVRLAVSIHIGDHLQLQVIYITSNFNNNYNNYNTNVKKEHHEPLHGAGEAGNGGGEGP